MLDELHALQNHRGLARAGARADNRQRRIRRNSVALLRRVVIGHRVRIVRVVDCNRQLVLDVVEIVQIVVECELHILGNELAHSIRVIRRVRANHGVERAVRRQRQVERLKVGALVRHCSTSGRSRIDAVIASRVCEDNVHARNGLVECVVRRRQLRHNAQFVVDAVVGQPILDLAILRSEGWHVSSQRLTRVPGVLHQRDSAVLRMLEHRRHAVLGVSRIGRCGVERHSVIGVDGVVGARDDLHDICDTGVVVGAG